MTAKTRQNLAAIGTLVILCLAIVLMWLSHVVAPGITGPGALAVTSRFVCAADGRGLQVFDHAGARLRTLPFDDLDMEAIIGLSPLGTDMLVATGPRGVVRRIDPETGSAAPFYAATDYPLPTGPELYPAATADRVFFADTQYNRIAVYRHDGSFVSYFYADPEDPLTQPHGISVDPDGALTVADTMGRRLLTVGFDADGQGTLTDTLALGELYAAHKVSRPTAGLRLSDTFWTILHGRDPDASSLLALDTSAGVLRRPSPGEHFYPAAVAALEDDLLVTDPVMFRLFLYSPALEEWFPFCNAYEAELADAYLKHAVLHELRAPAYVLLCIGLVLLVVTLNLQVPAPPSPTEHAPPVRKPAAFSGHAYRYRAHLRYLPLLLAGIVITLFPLLLYPPSKLPTTLVVGLLSLMTAATVIFGGVLWHVARVVVRIDAEAVYITYGKRTKTLPIRDIHEITTATLKSGGGWVSIVGKGHKLRLTAVFEKLPYFLLELKAAVDAAGNRVYDPMPFARLMQTACYIDHSWDRLYAKGRLNAFLSMVFGVGNGALAWWWTHNVPFAFGASIWGLILAYLPWMGMEIKLIKDSRKLPAEARITPRDLDRETSLWQRYLKLFLAVEIVTMGLFMWLTA